MVKGLAVWIACFLLFAAGCVWAQIPIPTDFFKVANIHDAFDIASSTATVAAVFIALTAWRKQMRAQADHDLARRLLITADQYKNVTFQVLIDAQFCLANDVLQYSEWSLIDRIQSSLRDRLNSHDEAKSAFQADLLEARALWGDEMDRAYRDLREVGSNAALCVHHFLMFLNESGNPDVQDSLSSSLENYAKYLSLEGLSSDPANISSKLQKITEEAETVLKIRLRG